MSGQRVCSLLLCVQVIRMLRQLEWVMKRGVEQKMDLEVTSLYDLLAMQLPWNRVRRSPSEHQVDDNVDEAEETPRRSVQAERDEPHGRSSSLLEMIRSSFTRTEREHPGRTRRAHAGGESALHAASAQPCPQPSAVVEAPPGPSALEA